MADHVGIGEVEHDQIVFAGVDGADRLVGEFRRRHFRLQIVGRDLGRRHHDAILALVGLLAAAVEEIGDVRVFLGLRHAQLLAAGLGHDLAEDVCRACGGKIVCISLSSSVLYCAMPTAAAKRTVRLRAKPEKSRIQHRAKNFAHAIGRGS